MAFIILYQQIYFVNVGHWDAYKGGTIDQITQFCVLNLGWHSSGLGTVQ